MKKTSTCVEKLPCKDCGSPGGLQTYLNVDKELGVEWFSSFCHSACWENKGDPYSDGVAPEVVPRTQEDIQEEIDLIAGCELFIPKRGFRGIPGEYYRTWRCRTLFSEYDGKTPYAVAFPMTRNGVLAAWKCRPLRKKDFFSYGDASELDPFGFERAIRMEEENWWVTEGEFDAIALNYCLNLAGNRPQYPVVSLTHGGGSIAKNLLNIEDRLKASGVKRLTLVLDDDEVGRLAIETARSMWDDVVSIQKPNGCKDANEAVMKNKSKTMGRMALS